MNIICGADLNILANCCDNFLDVLPNSLIGVPHKCSLKQGTLLCNFGHSSLHNLLPASVGTEGDALLTAVRADNLPTLQCWQMLKRQKCHWQITVQQIYKADLLLRPAAHARPLISTTVTS